MPWFLPRQDLRLANATGQREATYQVTLDALKLSPCYLAFLITVGVPEIYMHQFWNTVTKVKDSSSYQFKLDNKKFRVNAEVFCDILQICPKLPDKPFDIPPSTDEEIVSFIYELGYIGNIETLPELFFNHMYQPWRTFAAVINKCISGKTTGLDKLRLSRAQILWGMYHCKNVDFVELLWEDFAFHIDNHFSKESMPYPRFIKIIINHFISQNKSIFMRNRINLHTARDDCLLGTLKYVSKTEEHQVYGSLIPKEMLNEDSLNSTAYKTYYTYASEPTKKPAKAKKDVPSTKKPSSKPKPNKNKAPVKADRGKGLNVLSEVALSEAAQLKEVTKRSKTDFHISHASGSGDGTDFESGVPNEQQRKISNTDEGTGTEPGVPDVPKYNSKSEKESWGDSEEEEDDEDDTEDESDNDGNDDDNDGNDGGGDNDGNDGDGDNDGNDDDGDNVDNDDDSDHERTESDRDENPNLNRSNKEHEEEEEKYIDEFTDEEDDADNAKDEIEEELDDAEEFYRDVNVEEDAHVTLTAVHDTQKTEGPMQSSSISSDFTNKLLNFENASPTDNEIASLMDTHVRHEEPSSQTSSLFTVPITVIPEITSTFTTTIPPPHLFFNPLPQQATPTPTPTTSEVTTSFPALPDFLSVFRFNDRVTNLERDLSEMKKVDQYAQAISSIPTIVDRYIAKKQGEAIQKAIKSHTAFVMNQLNITNMTQELLIGPAFNLLKGTCKSRTELEYHFEECFKATTERLDWHNPEGKQYPFDLRRSLSSKYSTSVTKKKAATYEVQWIEDMVPNIWSPVKDVVEGCLLQKRIIAVTSLKIMKWYEYSHLDDIEVHREDQQLYKFKEGDFPRLRLQDIEDMLLLLVQQRLTNLTIDERYNLNVALPALSKKVNEESGEVRWWKRIRRIPQTA
ncbi:hypothetical protein Tco_0424633 [Tanacetum coccineum]